MAPWPGSSCSSGTSYAKKPASIGGDTQTTGSSVEVPSSYSSSSARHVRIGDVALQVLGAVAAAQVADARSGCPGMMRPQLPLVAQR